jgi:hypothetical protein
MNGQDELDFLLAQEADIARFEAGR